MQHNSINTTQDDLFFLEVDAAQAGLRLDKFLALNLPFSRTILQSWIEQNSVYVNQQIKTAHYRVKTGECLSVQANTIPRELAFTPQDLPLDKVYEDDDLIFIHKPIDMVVHPAPGHWQGTLVNALLHHYPKSTELPRAGIVHRLDKMTSGVLVVAKHAMSFQQLSAALADRLFQRDYLAIVHGQVPVHGKVDAAIGRHPYQRTKMHISHTGKSAVTHYWRLAYDAQTHTSLVHCRLETGRTHQIRVHLESIGHPLVGDAAYSNQKNKVHAYPHLYDLYEASRQALHAVRLGLNHPTHVNQILMHMVWPQDIAMQKALAAFGLHSTQDLGW